ncbi:DUF2303 family protein [Thiobacillus denitrificans]|uniref:DUF2303 domain-containing protein n=1 Tax=Thiobacillus denitrificans TaxID=36861 RepID=A0A106BHH9_THIDE|nr:DUF2303 family protein [Thiobacillus denitrificans]KVW92632.1 hypothetical protein ABW22_15760 [Thiobacillus denitrificans]
MEAAVIDKIGALTAEIAATITTGTVGEALYLPPGSTLQRAEQFAAQPRFHRHHYQTERLADFVAYAKAAANKASSAQPTAYVQPNGSGAQAVFDHGDATAPQWGHHHATLKLKPAPAWQAAQLMACATRSQQQVIEWLEDWAGAISAHLTDGAEIESRRAITALRRVKIEAKASTTNVEGDMSRQRSALESIEASGDTDTLPAYFVLHSPLFVGTCMLQIVIRLGVREADGKPALALRIVGAERLAEETSTWVEKHLAEQMGEALAGVYVGTLETGKP